jgi:predicted ATPase
MAPIVRGWALAGRSGEEGAAEQMRQGLIAWQATGAQLMRPHYLALLAEVLEPARNDEGLQLLDEALVIAETTGERSYQGELYRLKGERLLARATRRDRLQMAVGGGSATDASSAALAAAETCFNEALNVARRQGAQSLELRAAMSLARLYQQRGTRETSLDLLASIYSRFSEGFDTLDLRDARALLDARPAR